VPYSFTLIFLSQILNHSWQSIYSTLKFKSMKILHVLSQRPDSTGSGIYLQAMLREGAKQGYDNFLLAGLPMGETPHLTGLRPERGHFVRFNSRDLAFEIVGMSDVMPYPSKRWRDLSVLEVESYEKTFGAKLVSLVQDVRPDLIHSHHLWILTALTRRIFPELPVVATCHGSDLRQFHFCEHLRDRVEADCRKLHRIMALSRAQKSDILRLFGVPEEMVEVVGAGYNQSLFYPEAKSSPSPVEIVYVGKLSRAKGVPWLLKALTRLLHQPWLLHLVGGGTGEEKEEVLGLARPLGTRVVIRGPLHQEDMAAILRKAHLAVLPSFFEGLPLVVLEALAAGCRVVATALPGVVELLEDCRSETVSLVLRPRLKSQDQPYEEDEEVFVRELAWVLENQIQAAQRQPDFALTDVSQILNYYSWPAVFARVERVYQAVKVC
jgi:glycosyltransferase involved in cell wall biosynthesis